MINLYPLFCSIYWILENGGEHIVATAYLFATLSLCFFSKNEFKITKANIYNLLLVLPALWFLPLNPYLWFVAIIFIIYLIPNTRIYWANYYLLVSIISVQSLTFFAWKHFASFGIDIPITSIISHIIQSFGVHSSYAHNQLFFDLGKSINIRADILPPLLLISAMAVCYNVKLQQLLIFIITSVLYVIFIPILAIILSYIAPYKFVISVWLKIFIVFILYYNLSKLNAINNKLCSQTFLKVMGYTGGIILSLGLLLIISPPKTIKILIDDSHGDWETTKIKYDTINYGRMSTYNYYLFRKSLELNYIVTTTQKEITKLNDINILIIKTPTKPFSNLEVNVIENFVKKGGGLILIGDHTNLFGMTHILNSIANKFEIMFNDDASINPHDKDNLYFRKTDWNYFPAYNGIDSIKFLTSCSIKGNSLISQSFFNIANVVMEGVDYARPSFFGELKASFDDRSGPNPFGIISYYGKGKVLAFGDSTIWSNFCFYHSNYHNLLYNFIDLVGDKFPNYARLALIIFSVITFIILVIYFKDIIVLYSLGFLIGILIIPCIMEKINYREINYSKPVYIDFLHSNMELPISPTKNIFNERNIYSVFYAWISRKGISPLALKSYDNLDPKIPIIMVEPIKKINLYEIDKLDDYIQKGGNLLIYSILIQVLYQNYYQFMA